MVEREIVKEISSKKEEKNIQKRKNNKVGKNNKNFLGEDILKKHNDFLEDEELDSLLTPAQRRIFG